MGIYNCHTKIIQSMVEMQLMQNYIQTAQRHIVTFDNRTGLTINYVMNTDWSQKLQKNS